MIKTLAIATLMTTCTTTSFGAVTAEHRSDLKEQLQSLMCSESPQLDSKNTIALGIYDAQIDVRLIESISGAALTEKMLLKKSKALAAMKRYLGYTQGICSDQRKGWVAAIPAPGPLLRTANGFDIKNDAIKTSCKTHRFDFAATKGGVSTRLPDSKKIQTAKLGDGIVEVTCQPAFPRWQGPIVWYLAPTSDTALADKPKLANSNDRVSALSLWIASIRSKEGLHPIIPNDGLQRAAELLTIDSSVTHNRANTESMREKINTSDRLRVLGEIRVRGQSTEDLAWMLWHSPRHRDLLLQAEATSYGLAIKEVGTEFLAVFLGAEEVRPITASSGKKAVTK
jgi:hypothetical protein